MDKYQHVKYNYQNSVAPQLHQFLPPIEDQMNSIQNIFELQQNNFIIEDRKERKEPVDTENTIMPLLTKKISTFNKKRIRKYTSNNPNNKKGHWTHQENIKYHWFLELNAQKFIQRERRKVQKTFKSMSAFVQTRQAHQCRSHHQKMQKKLGTFAKILLSLRKNHYQSQKADILKLNIEKAGYQCQELIQCDLLQNEQKLYLLYCKIKSEKEVSQQNKNQGRQKYESEVWDNESSLFSEDKKLSSQNRLFLSDEYEDHFPTDIK